MNLRASFEEDVETIKIVNIWDGLFGDMPPSCTRRSCLWGENKNVMNRYSSNNNFGGILMVSIISSLFKVYKEEIRGHKICYMIKEPERKIIVFVVVIIAEIVCDLISFHCCP